MSLPEGWRETTLGEVVDVIDSLHRTPIYSSNGLYKMVRVTDIKRGSLNLTDCFKVDKEVFDEFSKKHKPKEFDIVFSRVGSEGIASLVRENQEFCLGQNTVFIIPKERISFLYHWFDSIQAKEEINAKTTGSTQRTISLKSIKELNIIIPPLQEQKSIANILSSFDNKIELLKEQNETLEQMAQGVFKESLNKFENTNKTTLGQLVKIKYGKDHKHLKDGDYPLYGSGGIMRHVEKLLYDKESILIPRKGTLSNLFFIQEPFWSVDTIFYTEIDDTLVSPIYLFYKLKRINLANLNVGSAVPSLTTNVLNALELEVPSRNEQEETVELLTSFNNKVLYNKSQIQILQKIRDTLLPKLMSGDVRIL